MIECNTIDVESFGKKQLQLSYPYIEVTNLNDTTPLIVPILEEGEMPLVAEYKGSRRILKRISMSAYNIDKLLRIKSGIVLHKEIGDVSVSSVREYLEAI